MSAYRIGIVNCEFWEGPPPALTRRKMRATYRPGVSGVTHHLLGTWGEPFETTVTSWWASQAAAVVGHAALKSMIGTLETVVYNSMNWSGLHGVLYTIEDVELIELRSNLWLLGPGISLAGGAALVTRVTMTPQEL